jgi:hypothetical protein
MAAAAARAAAWATFSCMAIGSNAATAGVGRLAGGDADGFASVLVVPSFDALFAFLASSSVFASSLTALSSSRSASGLSAILSSLRWF